MPLSKAWETKLAAALDMRSWSAHVQVKYAATIMQAPVKSMFGCCQLINDKRRVSVLGHRLLKRVE
jgi:hypothetical protein